MSFIVPVIRSASTAQTRPLLWLRGTRATKLYPWRKPHTLLQARLRSAAALAAVLAAVSSCATSIPAANRTPSPRPASSALSSSPTSAGPSVEATAASCGTGSWRTGPVSVTRHVSVPPVPIITAVRTGTHSECGYDRLVLDITGPVPGYDVRYVTHVIADSSGKAIALPGHSYLLITLRPVNAHADSGAATITHRAQALGYPMLKGYALVSDFEGVVTLALGLQSATSIRIGEVPGHWYLDVRS